jgi:hypothetical protein
MRKYFYQIIAFLSGLLLSIASQSMAGSLINPVSTGSGSVADTTWTLSGSTLTPTSTVSLLDFTAQQVRLASTTISATSTVRAVTKFIGSSDTGLTAGSSGNVLFDMTNVNDIGVQFYSNAPTGNYSPLFFVQDNASNNQVLAIWRHDGTGGNTAIHRYIAPTPKIEFQESDQTSPAGKCGIDVNNDTLRFLCRNAADTSLDAGVLLNRLPMGGKLYIAGTDDIFSVPTDAAKLSVVNTSTTLDYLHFSSASSTNIGNIFSIKSDGSVGIGHSSPSSTLHVSGSLGLAIRTISASTTAAATDYTLLINQVAANPVTVSLPTCVTANGRVYNVKKIDATTSTVVIDPNGSQTVDGNATTGISIQYESLQVQCDASSTNWFIL